MAPIALVALNPVRDERSLDVRDAEASEPAAGPFDRELHRGRVAILELAQRGFAHEPAARRAPSRRLRVDPRKIVVGDRNHDLGHTVSIYRYYATTRTEVISPDGDPLIERAKRAITRDELSASRAS